jgi:selenide,water dikinase
VLRDLPVHHDPRVLSGHDLADDAGIFRLSDDLALIQTIDFFTPVVDDPYTYGEIAAANALSDVYAMGGTPLTALNVTVFPTKTIPVSILGDILRGGADKTREAGVVIVGGHTVDGEEPMYGLSATGTIDPAKIVKPSGGQVGDVLVITKPLGTGVIATAVKAGMAEPAYVEESIRWMTRLNRTASEAMLEAGTHASTDITGFGLLGHLSEMARASGLAAELSASSIPVLSGALEYAERGFIPGGGVTNRDYVADLATFDADVSEPLSVVMSDPQTSGGLLMAVPPLAVEMLFRRLESFGDGAWTVGTLVSGLPGRIEIKAAAARG